MFIGLRTTLNRPDMHSSTTPLKLLTKTLNARVALAHLWLKVDFFYEPWHDNLHKL